MYDGMVPRNLAMDRGAQLPQGRPEASANFGARSWRSLKLEVNFENLELCDWRRRRLLRMVFAKAARTQVNLDVLIKAFLQASGRKI
jgi:hypothetical protein